MQSEDIARVTDPRVWMRLTRIALGQVQDPAERLFLRAVLVDARERPGRRGS